MKQEKSPIIVPDLGVLVVDMQNHYISHIPYKEELIQRHVSLLDYCAEYDIPAVNIRVSGHGLTVKPIRRAMRRVRRKYQLSKKTTNAFHHKKLAQKLNDWDISTVFITGVYYPSCVYETARGALDNGFSIMSAKNIVGGHKEGHTDFYDDFFRSNGGFFDDYKEAFPLLD